MTHCLNFIPKFNFDRKHKCEISANAKLTRTYFHSVERKSESLEFILTDLSYLKFIPTIVGNKYFVTLIDDRTNIVFFFYLL